MAIRALRLTGTALTAESLRIQLIARRQARRLAFLVLALLALSAAFVVAHILVWELFPLSWSGAAKAGCLLLVDLILAGLGAAFALRDGPTVQERDLRVWRDASLQEAVNGTLGPASLIGMAETAFTLFNQWRSFRASRPAPPPPPESPAPQPAAAHPAPPVTTPVGTPLDMPLETGRAPIL